MDFYLFFIKSFLDAKKLEHIAYSKYCRRIFYFGKNYDLFKTKESEITNGMNKVSNPKYNELDLHNITGNKLILYI